jgi:hypothetical protein
MNRVSSEHATTVSSLLKSTAVALLVAAVVLVVFVLPAEFGIDPTGIGARVGLTAMSEGGEGDSIDESDVALAAVAPAATEPVSVFDAVWKADTPFRTDEMTLTLAPNEGGEIKALMQVGQRLMFSWVAEGGAVNFDMHGEALNAPKDEFTSYWKGRAASSGNGAFEAPFAGTHGWYWRNRGATPITVRVKTSGYYEKLFRP